MTTNSNNEGMVVCAECANRDCMWPALLGTIREDFGCINGTRKPKTVEVVIEVRKDVDIVVDSEGDLIVMFGETKDANAAAEQIREQLDGQ